MRESNLNERALSLLKALVERYIHEGEPVGSRTLARATGLTLSAATIRNVMADLEELGYVHSPHTSAGRVPTVRAYRLFVDSLVPQPLTGDEQAQIERQLHAQAHSRPAQDVVEEASQLLAELSNMAALVTVPRRDLAQLRQIEFLPLSDRRVLAILVVNQREVENRIVPTHRNYTPAELEKAANYLNARFAGKDLHSVRDALLAELRDARASMDAGLADAMRMAEQLFTQADTGGDYVVAGQTHLLGLQDFSNVERLRDLFEAFTHKRDLLALFDHCLHAEGVQIFIGGESGYTALDECSVVTAPYTMDGQVVGSLGVIGPTRMNYHRVIPLVQSTAQLLGRALKEQS